MSSHDLHRFYALIPAFAALGVLLPQAFIVITASIGAAESLMRMFGKK